MSTRPSRVSATLAAWRIARRDAWRHKGRSILVIVMIGLPVMGVVFADVVWRTDEPSRPQLADQLLGERADALLVDTGTESVRQLPDPSRGWSSTDARSEPLDLGAVLPAAWSYVTNQERGQARFLSVGGDRAVSATLFEGRYADPLVAGLVRQLDGRAPTGDDEVVLTQRLADRLDLGVGDQLVATGGAGVFDVVGVVELTRALKDERVLGDPGTFDQLAGPAPSSPGFGESVYVDAGGPVAWEQVRELNELGLLVTSRAVLIDPPPCGPDNPCEEFGTQGPMSAEVVTLISLVAVMALLQIVLLAGPAFAIGRRSQSRDLALVAASGGERRHVGGVVRGGGIVLGGIGALLGAALAIVGFLLFRPQLSRLGGADLPTIDLRPIEIAIAIGVGILTGLLAAWLPAWQASRQDVVAALAGRRPTPRVPKVVPALGAVAVALGVMITLYGAGPGDSIAIVAGSVVAELGLVAMSPTLVAWVARIGPRLPAVPRLALRDAARSRGRSGPAVAAVMAAVAGAVAVSIFATSQEAADERGYTPSLQHGWAAVSSTTADDADVSELTAAVQASLPVERTYPVAAFQPDYETCSDAGGCEQLTQVVPDENLCPAFATDRTVAPSEEELQPFVDDPRCANDGRSFNTNFGEYIVGDAATFAALTGSDDPDAIAAIEQGGLVAFDRNSVLDGESTLQVLQVEYAENAGEPDVLRQETFPAAFVDVSVRPGFAFLSVEAAADLDLPVRETGAVFETSRMPTQEEEDRANRQLELASQAQAYIVVERGYQNDVGLALLILIGVTVVIALGATAIAVGLAAADSRPDLATLAAVGAAPRTRRLLTASQALVIAGLGTLLGIGAGFVPGIAAVRTQYDWSASGLFVSDSGVAPTLPVVVPWWNLAILLVVVPLLAVICGALFSRSRLPMVRRLG